MRFWLAFHITLVIKDKNKLDVHIPYTDIQSTHWYIYIHTTINTHKDNIGRWQKAFSLMSDILPTRIFSKSLQYYRYHMNYTRWAKKTEGNLLYIQLLNLQYFLAVAFKSTNCHADSSIYWHSLYKDNLSACNGPFTVLSRRLPIWVLDTIGTKGEWQWLATLVLLVRVRHWEGIWEKRPWQSTSLPLVGSILQWTVDF